jgi:hypothetical protein
MSMGTADAVPVDEVDLESGAPLLPAADAHHIGSDPGGEEGLEPGSDDGVPRARQQLGQSAVGVQDEAAR